MCHPGPHSVDGSQNRSIVSASAASSLSAGRIAGSDTRAPPCSRRTRSCALSPKPTTVLLSFAPVSDFQDLEFLAWLGASVTPRTEEALAASDEKSLGRSSLELARTLWSHLSAAALQSRPAVPLGVNIEEVSLHNFDLAVQMARDFPSWREAKSPRADHV